MGMPLAPMVQKSHRSGIVLHRLQFQNLDIDFVNL
jgi:hypothetical protein